MKLFSPRFLLPVLLCLSLSSCYSSICSYVWNRAEIAEATWIPQPDNAKLYRVGDAFYAKAHRGMVRGTQDGCFSSIVFSEAQASWKPVSDENETIYLKVELHVRSVDAEGPFIYKIIPDRSSLLTRLPENAVRLNGAGHLPRVKTEARYRKLCRPEPCTEPETDVHALYAYPLGLATAVVVDVPCTVAMSVGGIGFAILSLPWYLYKSIANN